MKRGSCVDWEEEDATLIDSYKDELCSTCYNLRIKEEGEKDDQEETINIFKNTM